MVRTVLTNGVRRIGDDRDILVTEWVLENETIQVFKPMYRAVHDYFIENGWVYPTTGDEKYEDLYWHRIRPNGDKEQWIWWRLVQDKNEFIRWLILFDFQTLFVKPREKLYKGKKVGGIVEMNNLKMFAKFYLQFDIHDRFKKSPVWKFKRVFFNRIYKQEIEQHKEELLDFAQKLNHVCKSLMALDKDHAWPALQYGKLGYADWGDSTQQWISK